VTPPRGTAITISHGDIESGAEAQALQAVIDLARSRCLPLRICGGSDYLTVDVPPPAADVVVSEIADFARAEGVVHSWRVELSSRPERG
jgi:hypothetical protein